MYMLIVAYVTGLICASTATYCPEDNEEILILPSPINCSSYLVCDRGQEFIRLCSSDLEYNTEYGICDYPENVPCFNETKLGPPCPPIAPGGDAIYMAHPSNCSKYFVCGIGDKFGIGMSCPGKLIWNVELSTCDKPENYNCTLATKSRPLCHVSSVDQYITNSHDCRSFYYCHASTEPNIPSLVSCPEDTYFDESSIQCVDVVPDRCNVKVETTTEI